MECNCGLPVRQSIYKDGRPCYSCAHGGCRFFGFAPVHCEGYQRIIANNKTPPETCVVRFEALLHPVSHAASVMANIYTPNEIAGRSTEDSVRQLLESAELSPSFLVAKRTYLYPMEQYATVVSRLKAVPHALVQEIPTFFFRTMSQTRELPAKHAAAVADGSEAPLDPADDVYVQLKKFQKAGVDFVVRHGGRGMIADDMGLGKTIQSIAVAHHFRAEWPVLVVCPMSLVENWAKEFNKFCSIPFSRIAVLQGTKARAESIHEVVIVSYSSLKCVEGERFQVVLLDESHYIKAGDSKRTQLALKLCHAAKRVVLLSGTPAMSRPMELYTQLSAIHASMVPTKTQYAARYCNGHLGRFGMDYQGHSHIDELHFLIQDFVIRRTKKELSEAELPSKSRQLLYVYITAKEKKALEKQVSALRQSMQDRSPAAAGAGASHADAMSRAPNAFELKIATARAKVPAVQDYVSSVVEQHLDSGEKIIFFAHHQCMMEAIRTAVTEVRPKQPIDYIYITGETPAAQREQLAAHFRQEPTCTVAVLSMGSSGTGHNFTCASTVVFAELDWNPSTHLQCEDRVHRIGQSNPCTIKYLLADGTSDDVIWPLLQSKLTVTSAVLESGVATAEHNRLSENADKQKVSRRDVSSEAASTTQGTLDGCVRRSNAASQTTARSGSVSTSVPPVSHARTDVVRLLAEEDAVADDDEVVVVVSPESSRSGARSVEPKEGRGSSSHALPLGRQATSGTLPTPPLPDTDTQVPDAVDETPPSATVKPRPPPSPKSATPPQGCGGPPLVISIEELRRCPHLLRAVPPGWSRGRHSHSNGRGSQGHLAGSGVNGGSSGSAAAISGGNGTASVAVGSGGGLHSPKSVLDMMVKRSQAEGSADGDVVVVEGDVSSARREAATADVVQCVPRGTTFHMGAPAAPTAALAGAQGQETRVTTDASQPQSCLGSASAVTGHHHVNAAIVPLDGPLLAPSSPPPPPRRTTFTLKPVPSPAAPPAAEASPHASAVASLPPPPQPSAPARPSGSGSTHTVAHIPLNFVKRPRRPSGGDGAATASSDAAVSPHQPLAAVSRAETPAPVVVPPILAQSSTAPATGKRTTFRFTTASRTSSDGAPAKQATPSP